MSKIVDIEKVQDALDRAARNAKRGSSDIRAGRFVYRNTKDGRFVAEDKLSPSTNARRNRKEK